MKDALTRMQEIEAKFRAKASEFGLDLDKLYELQSTVPSGLILRIEEEEPNEENAYHAAKYLNFLTPTGGNAFMMTAMMLSVWKLGGNPKGLLLAGEAVMEASDILNKLVEVFDDR